MGDDPARANGRQGRTALVVTVSRVKRKPTAGKRSRIVKILREVGASIGRAGVHDSLMRREVAVKFTMNPNHQGERNETGRRFGGFIAQETGFGEGNRECKCEPAGTPGNFGMMSTEIAARN